MTFPKIELHVVARAGLPYRADDEEDEEEDEDDDEEEEEETVGVGDDGDGDARWCRVTDGDALLGTADGEGETVRRGVGEGLCERRCGDGDAWCCGVVEGDVLCAEFGATHM